MKLFENEETWYPNWTDGNFKELFTIQDVSWEFKIFIHPTGKYCYIVVINKHYILRSDYNEKTKSFAPPYVVAGQARNANWIDGVGTGARISRPYQGCFVKNETYAAENRDDVYDFYFCDNWNHCIRYLTPDGIVRIMQDVELLLKLAMETVGVLKMEIFEKQLVLIVLQVLRIARNTKSFYILDTKKSQDPYNFKRKINLQHNLKQ